MEKFKYIIILALSLTIVLFYIKIENCENISSKLINDNKQLSLNIQDLEEEKERSSKTIQNLNDKIYKLEENITNLMCNTPVVNDTKNEYKDILKKEDIIPPALEKEEDEKPQTTIEPNIIFDDNKDISGFEFKYKQNF